MESIKAISTRQPYATLIMMGLKGIETKTTNTTYRGPVLVHASGTMGPRERAVAIREGFDPDALPRGQILGVVEIVDAHPVEALQVDNVERSVGDYSAGRWGWILQSPRPLGRPVTCGGALSFWQPTPEALAQVAAQIDIPERVFVYGTLKRGHGNHRLLKTSRFLGERSIRGRMHHLGGFPAIAVEGRGVVHGELYEVDQATMRRLDCLEGCPTFYQRTRVRMSSGGWAWVYVMDGKELVDREEIPSGRWG